MNHTDFCSNTPWDATLLSLGPDCHPTLFIHQVPLLEIHPYNFVWFWPKGRKENRLLLLQQEFAVKVFRMTDCLFNCLDKFGSSKQRKNYLYKHEFKSNPWLSFGSDDKAGRSNRNQEASLLSFKKTVVFLLARWLSFLAYLYPDKDTKSLCVSTTIPGASVFSNNYCPFSFHKISLCK